MRPEALTLIAQRFKVLGDPVRLQILQVLHDGERSVSQVIDAVAVAQSSVSKHLKVLQEAGFVGRRQTGTIVHYRITDPLVWDLCDAVCKGLQIRLATQAHLLGELPH